MNIMHHVRTTYYRVLVLFVAARIYSAGVLLYGQRVGLRQLLKMARISR